MALVATQIGLLSTSLSLPMLAPLLLGTGMLLRSIRTNASLVFPRIGLLVVLLWLLWFANSVIQNTVAYLRKQVSAPHSSVSFVFSAPPSSQNTDTCVLPGCTGEQRRSSQGAGVRVRRRPAAALAPHSCTPRSLAVPAMHGHT